MIQAATGGLTKGMARVVPARPLMKASIWYWRWTEYISEVIPKP